MRRNTLQSLTARTHAAVILCVLAILALTVDASMQQYVVCKVPKSFKCIIWLTDLEHYVDVASELNPSSRIAKNCYYSDLKPFFGSPKTITVEPISGHGPKRQLTCISKTLLHISRNDWPSVEKAFESVYRVRRAANYSPRGHYRGQTQSQYLAIDRGSGKDEGKAEAHSAADSSRATVIGSSGMGQAQSQSMYDPSCKDCVGSTVEEAANLRRPIQTSNQGGPSRGNGFGDTVSQPGGYAGIRPYEGNGNDGYGPNQQGSRIPSNGFNQNFGQTGPNSALGSASGPNSGSGSRSGPSGNFSPTNASNGGLNSIQSQFPGVNGNGGYGSAGPPRYDYNRNVMPSGQLPYNMNGIGTNGIGANSGPGPRGMLSGQNGVLNSSGVGPNGMLSGQGGVGQSGVSNTSGIGPTNILSGHDGLGRSAIPTGNGIIDTHNGGVPSAGGAHSGYGPTSSQVTGEPYPGGSGSTLSGNGNQIAPGHNGMLSGVGLGNNGLPSGVNMQPGGFGSSQNIPRANGGLVPQQNGLINKSGTFPGGTNWPSSGFFKSPDGVTYYCCVASPNNVPQHFKFNNGGVPETIGMGQYGAAREIPYSAGNSGQGSIGPYTPGIGHEISGLYKPGTAGPGTTGPYLTGTGAGYGAGGPYSSGFNQGSRGPYTPAGTGDQVSTGLYTPGPGIGHGASGLYPLGGQDVHGAVGPYTPGVGGSLGIAKPSVRGDLGQPVQYGPERDGQGTGGAYPTGGGQGLSGPYNIGVGRGQGSNGLYMPAGVGQGSGGPYNVVSGQRPPGPGGQGPTHSYGPGGSQSNAPYGSGTVPGFIGSYGPGSGQVTTGTFGQGPVHQYGSDIQGPTGSYSRDGVGSIGQYVPISGQESVGPNGQGSTRPYGQSGQGPIGTYGTGIGNGVNGPYSIGGSNQGAIGSYKPGVVGSQGSGVPYGSGGVPEPGLYTPGGAGGHDLGRPYTSGVGVPGSSGSYTPRLGSSGSEEPGGHTPGSGGQGTDGTSGQPPSGLYAQGVEGGQGVPASYTPGVGSSQSVGGSYVPGLTGQGSGGQYDPRAGGGSLGPYTPWTGGGQGYGGSYIPGTGTGGPYGPEIDRTGSRGSYVPGIGVGESLSGPYGGGVGTQASGGQYGPHQTEYNQMGQDGQSGIPQNVIDPNLIADGDDSEAEAIVSQAANGTTASASSRGGNDKGRAQTNVHGTYTGSGSFAAQAEITGENKAANSEVAGDKKGASSTAQGKGRNNKSQANVKLGSETGAVLTGSQSEGIMHSSNTQVQGSIKGGMADAQAKGPGSTSSQAQIGFTPYKDGDESHDSQKTPFIGGGIASAQSSGRIGKSQSQLHGTFKYGITYNGAAQAGASLDKDAVFPNRLPFDKIDVFDENNKNINVDNVDSDTESTPSSSFNITAEPDLVPTTDVLSETEFTTDINKENEHDIHTHSDHHQSNVSLPTPTHTPPVESRRSFKPTYSSNSADYEYSTDKDYNNNNPPDDYDVDDGFGPEVNEPVDPDQNYVNTNYNEFSRTRKATHQSLYSPKRKGIEVRQTTAGNTQHIVLGSLGDQDAEITQKNSERPDESKVYQPGERVPGTGGFTIPFGFTGSVKSVASKEKTYVIGSKESPSQAQTVSLSPGSGKIKYKHPAYGKNVNPKNLRSLYQPNSDDNNRYVSVSKSVTRALDGENNVRKQYSHTYYTKSSSCGYFTFTCTMVSSAEGKKKVCKPKIPTNPDGTPMRC